MFRRLRTRRARWVAAAAATLTLAGGGLAVVAGPAYAEPFPLTDDFEGTPTARWVADAVPNQTAVRFGNHPDAGSDHGKVATLDAGAIPVSAIARAYRTVNPDPVSPRPLARCTMSLSTKWIQTQNPTFNPAEVYLFAKIRLGGPTGTISLAKTKRVTSTGWQRWDVGSMFYTGDAFTIDLHIYNGVLLIDDLSFACRNLI